MTAPPFCSRWPLWVGLFLVWALPGRGEAPYYEPDLSTPLFDVQALSLSPEDITDTANQLAAITRLDAAEISPRLCTMSLSVALHLRPRHRASLIANHRLRRRLPPKRQDGDATKAQIVYALGTVRGKLSTTPDDRILRALMADILAALSNGAGPAEEAGATEGRDPWRGTVPPKTLELPTNKAATFYLGPGGQVYRLELRGTADYAHARPALFAGTKAYPDVFGPGTFTYEAILREHPYVAEHLELTLSIEDPLTGDPAVLAPEEWPFPVALLTRLLFKPGASAHAFLLAGRLDGRGGLLAPPDLRARMNRLDLGPVNEEKSRIRGILLPATPPLYWRDWLLFHRMEKVLACELWSVSRLEDALALCAGDSSLQQRREAYAAIQRRLRNLPRQRDGRHVLIALQRSPVLREQLGVLAGERPLLLSAQLLLEYVHLPLRLRASLPASAAYLRGIAAPFLTDSLKDLSGSRAHHLCTETVADLLHHSPRLHLETLPLASKLSKVIDQLILPYTRLRHKNTEGARRQLAEVEKALAAWQDRLDRIAP